MGDGAFVKISRSGLLDAFDLIREHRPAFLLLFFIAMRARREPSIREKLGIGEVKIGSNSLSSQLGLTEGEYRTAKKKLEQAGIATFRATNWGTVAKLISTAIFDPNFIEPDGLDDELLTVEERAQHGVITTNKKEEIKKKRKVGQKQDMTYEDRVGGGFKLIMADEAQLGQWGEAYPKIDILQQMKQAQTWLLANPEKKRTNFKRFLVNWFARAASQTNFGASRPVSPQFALKMRLEYENTLKKLNDEKDTIEASLAICVGDESRKRLTQDLQMVKRKISDLESTLPGQQ